MLAFDDFPPPVRLMLFAARARISDHAAQSMQALIATAGDPFWQQFLAVTAHHRLGALVFETLTRLDLPLPAAIRHELHTHALQNAVAAARSVQQVRLIEQHFATAGIPLVVMKGVPLSQLLFNSPNARHVGDIDLLTTPNDLAAQVRLMDQLGYTLINPRCRLTPLRIARYRAFWKDFTFRSDTEGFELDLHWRLFNNRLHGANHIPERAAIVTVNCFGQPLRVFDLCDQFLYIAAHGISDAFTYFKSLADVAAFLTLFTPAQLDEALARAQSLGILAQVSAAVHLANAWMGASAASPRLLPPAQALSRQVRELISTQLLRHHFMPHRSSSSPAQWTALELKLVPGPRSMAEIARRFVWRPRVWSSVDLPDRWFWIYPLIGLFLLPRLHRHSE